MTVPRTRDAAVTRHALLTAARELFAADGFDATTVRAVSDRAGVNQALLFRYFGNKEGLFAEAVRGQALELLNDTPRAHLLERVVDAVLDTRGATSAEPFLAVLRGAGSTGGTHVRAELAEAYTSAFADLVDTSDRGDAEARAALLLAWLLGLTWMRTLSGSGPDPRSREHVLRTARALLA